MSGTATVEVRACPVCRAPVGGDAFVVRGLRLTCCRSCGTTHALEHADPATVYVDGYHSGVIDSPAFASYVWQVERRRARRVARLGGRRLLDVGCGTGRFLEAVAGVGLEPTGLEPVAATAAGARERGLDVLTGQLHDAVPGGWDVVTAFHVLEHLPDVPEALQLLKQLVRPGGHLVVEVPNWRSMCRHEAGDSWSLLGPGEHVTFFTRRSLRAALQSAGFEEVRVSSPSWVGEPQALDQALVDLGLRRGAAVLRPVSRRDGEVIRPRRSGWAVLRALDAAESVASVGLTLLATARVP
ncbi:MAG: class I SAM-dependent methyltransferase [Actinomycetes bacterium]